ncbi:hypothetical protein M407DRAFT_246560 [Tulasnella calospora MUT 4182]|uniref:Uncharacterized protein n=1 Tax=Tulasnella calospora MUT 4182 TaxID=1051891 RepID=A0A0C3PTN6_9AGAM|nr:hypothetical protein M407DRAFT_246560 [Tulasnella calospora MUT 4182]
MSIWDYPGSTSCNVELPSDFRNANGPDESVGSNQSGVRGGKPSLDPSAPSWLLAPVLHPRLRSETTHCRRLISNNPLLEACSESCGRG